MGKVSYKPYYNEKTGDVEVEVHVLDLVVGICAGLTAKKIVEGMSNVFCNKKGLVSGIGTAALGIYFGIDLGVKAGAMFRSIRKGMKKAYESIRDIPEPTEEQEEVKEEKKDEEVKWDPAPDISEEGEAIENRYEHPENWLCFSSYTEADKVSTFCKKSIIDFGYVSVVDVKEEMENYQMFNYLDNIYGWSNLDDFDVKMEPDRQWRYSITRVQPYPIDILKQSEGIKHGESEA